MGEPLDRHLNIEETVVLKIIVTVYITLNMVTMVIVQYIMQLL